MRKAYINLPFMETNFREKMVSIKGLWVGSAAGEFRTFERLLLKQNKKENQGNGFSLYSNMPCFSKMISINRYRFPLKGHGFP
jgi:hypothetical protein